MKRDIKLKELISSISDLSVKYRLTTGWGIKYENEDVNDFYENFNKDFEKIGNQLGKLENKMIKYWGKV